jgi:C1A family cysteine protease
MLKKKLFALGLVLICVLFFVNALSFADELSDIQAAIKAKGAKWAAGETSISRLSPEERKMRLGLIKPAHVQAKETLPFQEQASGETTSGLPSLDLRDYVTPVKDQGNCGSCWAFATTGALESATLISEVSTDPNLDLAEQILVSCSGAGNCGGGYISYASDFIRDTGLPLESCYPYTAENGKCRAACSSWWLSTSKITNWNWVTTTSPTVDAIKTALYNYGPLVTTMDVYTDFFYYNGDIYSYAWGNYEGGHAVLIVGYDDPGQYFIVKNSWGTNWGESGYFNIAYSQLISKVYFGDWTIAYHISAEAPTITVTSPTDVEIWQAGTTQTIKWTYIGNPGSYVKIELLKSGDPNRTISSSASIGSSGLGSFNWKISPKQTPYNDYSIRVTSTTTSSCTDTSDYFAITAPSRGQK